jgi:hypothetical protein
MIVLVRGVSEWIVLPFCILLSLLIALYKIKAPK